VVGIASALDQNQLAAQRPSFGQEQSAAQQAAGSAAERGASAQANQQATNQQTSAAGSPTDPNASTPTAQQTPRPGPTLTTGFLSPVIQFDTQTSQVLFQFRDFETGDVERQIPPEQAVQAFVAAGAQQGTPPAQAAEEEAALAAEAETETEAVAAAAPAPTNADQAASDAEAAATEARPAATTAEAEDPVAAPLTASVESTGEQTVATAGAAGPQTQPGPTEDSPVTGAELTPSRVDTLA